jgi:hypothetical protein
MIDYKQIRILWLLHGVVNGCYYGAFETWGVLLEYTKWVDTPALLLEALYMNIGFVYTNCRDIIMYIRQDLRTPVKTVYGFGRATGQIYYFIFIASYFSQIFDVVSPVNIDYVNGSITAVPTGGTI